MQRREFITLISASAAAWPVAAGAQQLVMPVVGILGSTTAEGYASRTAAFMQGLQEMGFAEGQSISVEARWANDQYDQLPELVNELMRKRVSLIAALGNNQPARAAKAATSNIPIVFSMGADPVAYGLVASLNRPGGNVTGTTVLSGDIIPKRVQLLRD